LERFDVTPGSIETLFVGGGTPSTIAPELFAPIFEMLSPFLSPDAEITVEANPNSATRSWLSGMHDLGVNRVSLGVQSFDEKKLIALGRAHSPHQAREAILTAHALGIPHLSLDLIYNVHGDTFQSLESDIQAAFELPIDHLSAYELTIEANTPFAATPHARQTDDDLAFFVADTITQHGFEHYEISNFGTYQSRHNLGYWQLKEYIGAGAGAVGFRGLTSNDLWRGHESFAGLTPLMTSNDLWRGHEVATRYYPPTDIDAYLHDPLAIREEHLTANDLLTERIFLGLRSRVGIERAALPEAMRTRAEMLVHEGRLTATPTHYFNPNFFLADEIALFLIADP
jgi:oxygen-independent coproporphyrinogen-3 oxidase